MKTYPKIQLIGAVAAISTSLAGMAFSQPDPMADDPRAGMEPQMREMMEMLRDGGPLEGAPHSNQWQIGVLVTPLDPVLRMHLELPDGAGVLVQEVVAGSPAKKAGLERNDIIVVAGDRKIDSLPALKDAVTQAFNKGDSLDLAVIRKGKQRQVTVKREGPQENREVAGEKDSPARPDQMQQQFRQFREVRQAMQDLQRQVARQQRQINQLERRIGDSPRRRQPAPAPEALENPGQ